MGIANNFPVFEADQVLSNKHLNDLFNYLDQQDRLTRCKLIGSGIVCGLEITYSQQAINVSKGSALTSQGFMALHCDNDYTHYIPYTPPVFPKDIAFISQCAVVATANTPFYKPGFENELFQLITADAFNKLDAEDKSTATILANVSTADLDKYAVVLFLEAEEVSLKNCDTNDCNDKGSRMEFVVKLLLVKKATLDSFSQDGVRIAGAAQSSDTAEMQLKRYNVPVTDLNSASDVLNVFTNLVNDALLKKLADALNECYNSNKFLFENEPDNPFSNAFQQLVQLKNTIIATEPVLIQYFYDFIDDLIKAYHEFMFNVTDTLSECCGNEMRFPLHVMLGDANNDTGVEQRSSYRQYFIYSPLYNSQAERLRNVRLLFTRIKLMFEEFFITGMVAFEKNAIKITPSRYGKAPLSKRCIPYYYNVAESGKELYSCWDYDKTCRGRSKFNLSYHASAYATADTVLNPLLYDIEKFDFFRIEGHIGKSINDALIKIKQAQENYNLPFDTIAVSADYIGALVKGEEPVCVIQDLESDYRVMIAEFICRVHDALCFAGKVLYTGRPTFPPVVLNSGPLSTTASAMKMETGFSAAAGVASAIADDDDESKLVVNAINASADAVGHNSISIMVSEYHATQKYLKGDTLSRLCNPAKGTVGNKYIAIIKANKGVFTNPVAFRALVPISALHYSLFEFIDRVESLFGILMSNDLAALNISSFNLAFKSMQSAVNNLKKVSPIIAAEVEMTFDSCIVERLEALKNEYLRRVAQFRLAKNFNYYFKKHGGIEHKAGVPKGGTFILVYHELRKSRFIDVRSMFINKELSSLMMAHFPALLKPAEKVNHLEFQAGLLETATLYKDPELHLRLKEVMQKYVDECHDLPDDRRKAIIDIINKPPEQNRFVLENEMVIADFYVPYICCSDCPPITYILPAPPIDTSSAVAIELDTKKFCNNDRSSYPVKVTPVTEGVINGAGVKMTDGGYVFFPENLSPGIHTITYTAHDQSASLQVEIIANPKAAFEQEVSLDENGNPQLKFTNKSIGATTYAWDFGDGASSVLENPIHVYSPDSIVAKVRLIVTNDICSDSLPKEISIKKEVITKDLQVCSNAKPFVLEAGLKATDVVKVLSNDGLKVNEAKLMVSPVATDTSVKKVFHISYTVNDQQTDATITIVTLNADFKIHFVNETDTPSLSFINITLESISKDYTNNEWQVLPVTGSSSFSDDPVKDIKIGIAAFRLAKKITIVHVISRDLDTGKCETKATYEIAFADYQKAIEKKDFDNHTVF